MKKRLISLLLAAVLFVCLFTPAAALDTPSQLRHSVACIIVWNEINGMTCGIYVRGTGFFVGKNGEDPQYLITNEHVIHTFIELGSGSQTRMSVADWASVFLANEEFSSEEELDAYIELLASIWSSCTQNEYANVRSHVDVYFSENEHCEAYLVEADQTHDFAVLRLDAPTDKRSAMPICIPSEEMVGHECYAVGFPGIADNTAVEAVQSLGEADATVNKGQVNRFLTETGTGTPQIQNNAMTHQGNSGGPLVYENGAAIGITTSSVRRTDDSIPLYYAVNISIVKPVLDRNGVPYELVEYPEPSRFPVWVAVLIAVVAVAAIAAAVVMLVRKTRGAVSATTAVSPAQPSPQPAPSAPPVGDSGFRVQGIAGALEGRRTLIPAAGSLIIGRDPERCGLVLPADTAGVSGRHCALWADNGEIWLKDLGSSHGTFIAPGQRLSAEQPVKMTAGELFWLGSEAQSFVVAEKRG